MSEKATDEPVIHKGLNGVVADYTAVSKVNPDTNSLLYRGYPVQELAANCSFEEVAYLMWNGELPSNSNVVDVHMVNMRAKLRDLDGYGIIRTVRGIGYALKTS